VQDSHTQTLRDFDRKIGYKYEVSEKQISNIVPAGVPIIQTHKKVLAKRVIKEIGSMTSALRRIK
jgi:hypothetical protein